MTDRNPELWFGVEVADEDGVTLGTCGGILLDGDGVETWLVVRGGTAEPADDAAAAENGTPGHRPARVVPIAGAERTDGVVRTPYPVDLVRGGPVFPPDVMILTEAERAALRSRYGLRADPAAAPPPPRPEAPGPPATTVVPAAGEATSGRAGGSRRTWGLAAVALVAVAGVVGVARGRAVRRRGRLPRRK